MKSATETPFAQPAAKDAEKSKGFIEDDSRNEAYATDEFRMQSFKVISCAKRYSHDWTICPFAHPGEKARRRDPKQYSYAGIACPDMKKMGLCSKGDKCPYAHNVFEYWLHPSRYRTQLCNDGIKCTRHVCFFAHTLDEMRSVTGTPSAIIEASDKLAAQTASPDTPFNLHSTGSTSSSSEGNPSILDVANSLANVKMAISGDNNHRNQYINMLSTMLRDAVKEQQAAEDTQPGDGMQRRDSRGLPQRQYDQESAQALEALERSQAQALLSAPRRSRLPGQQDWNTSLQDLDADFNGSSLHRAAPYSNPIFTAPAALDAPVTGVRQPLGLDTGNSLYSGSDVAHMLSSDVVDVPPTSFWQQTNTGPALPNIPRPNGRGAKLVRRTSDTEPVTPQLNLGPVLNGGLFSNKEAHPHNPSALRRQSYSFGEEGALGVSQQRKDARRPPLSAFQTPTTAPDWNTQRAVSGDLAAISEAMLGLPPLSDAYLQRSSMGALQGSVPSYMHNMNPADRTQSAQLLESLNGLQLGAHGGNALSHLHSAPYDLGALAGHLNSQLGSGLGLQNGQYDPRPSLDGLRAGPLDPPYPTALDAYDFRQG